MLAHANTDGLERNCMISIISEEDKIQIRDAIEHLENAVKAVRKVSEPFTSVSHQLQFVEYRITELKEIIDGVVLEK